MKKGSKKKFKKKIIINTSRSRSELKLIKILCEKNNWKEVYTEGDVNFYKLLFFFLRENSENCILKLSINYDGLGNVVRIGCSL